MRWLCLMGLMVVGCDDSFEPATPEPIDDLADGCPIGLSQASQASLVMTMFTVNGAGLVTDFVENNAYNGVPAACASEDGLSLQMHFEVAGEGYGLISMTHQGAGSYEANELDGVLTIELFGADIPTTYSTGDWQTASWNVEERNDAIASDFFGTGFVADQSAGFNFQLQVTP